MMLLATFIPRVYEDELVRHKDKLRALRIKVGKSLMIGQCNHMVRGTSIGDKFKDKQVC